MAIIHDEIYYMAASVEFDAALPAIDMRFPLFTHFHFMPTPAAAETYISRCVDIYTDDIIEIDGSLIHYFDDEILRKKRRIMHVAAAPRNVNFSASQHGLDEFEISADTTILIFCQERFAMILPSSLYAKAPPQLPRATISREACLIYFYYYVICHFDAHSLHSAHRLILCRHALWATGAPALCITATTRHAS